MKISKICIVAGSLIVVAYGLWLWGVPALLNSPKMIERYETFLTEKLGVSINIEALEIKTNSNLSISLSLKELKAEDVLSLKGFDFQTKSLSIKPYSLSAQDIFVDVTKLKPLLKSDKKSQNKSFNLDFFPIVNVENAYIKIDESGKAFAQFSKIHSEKTDGKIVSTFEAKLQTPYTKSPIYIGKSGAVHYLRKVYFDNLSVDLDSSKLLLSGEIDDLSIKGKALPVRELESAFLYFYKLKHPNKKNFIENFSNFSGNLDVDLVYSKKNLNGSCSAHNLRAEFFDFNFPIYLPNVDFIFDGRRMSAQTRGTFALEPVLTDVQIEELFSDRLHTVGHVSLDLTDKVPAKYFNKIKIQGKTKAFVKYEVKNSVPEIDYKLTMPKGSDILTKYGGINHQDKIREISAHTRKDGDKIYLTNYDFGFRSGELSKIVFGDGLFEKENGHFKPSFITMKTNGEISTDVISSLVDNFIYGGSFCSDLRYDFKSKNLQGALTMHDIRHKDFLYLKNVNVQTSAGNHLKTTMDGTFMGSPITFLLQAKGNLNAIEIEEIDIYLEKYCLKRGEIEHKKDMSGVIGFNSKYHLPEITVKQGRIRVNEIINPRFYLHDVEILGSLKNDIADFIIPKTEYANGILSAKGKYNIANHSSHIYFLASDIDSNEVATKVFHLPNQFEGSGYASLELVTKNKFNDIKAHANFAIDDGFLPKLGSREFIINKSTKKNSILSKLKKPLTFTLSKISNIDFSKPNIFYSDLRGSFLLDNYDIYNVKIFSQSDYLSLFIEGKYNIDTEIGDLTLWGKHDKIAEKKIRILKVPLSWLYRIFFKVERSQLQNQDKINQIPPINAKTEDMGIFRVEASGNINDNDVKIILKDLK